MIELWLRYADGREYTETCRVGIVPPEVMLSALIASAKRAGNTVVESQWYRLVDKS